MYNVWLRPPLTLRARRLKVLTSFLEVVRLAGVAGLIVLMIVSPSDAQIGFQLGAAPAFTSASTAWPAEPSAAYEEVPSPRAFESPPTIGPATLPTEDFREGPSDGHLASIPPSAEPPTPPGTEFSTGLPQATPSLPFADAAGIVPPAEHGPYTWDFGFVARGYYLNDQRIQWSGLEAYFGAEGAVRGKLQRELNGGKAAVQGEFFLNQPFDRNILVDTNERRSYLGNYDIEPFEIDTLNVSYSRNNWTFQVGKMVTPFGRYYFPLFTNLRVDAPFIRTEAILWRETGILAHYKPGWFVADLAITNGSVGLDTNSSKAILSRLGVETECFAAGCSAKTQDGLGSEGQKEYKNYFGADMMFRCNRFVLSGEAIYDEYGLRHPLNADDITWDHSIYYREQYHNGDRIHGVGYYVDLGYDAERYLISINYGEYYPEQLGVPQHDVTNRRGLAKGLYRITPQLHVYSVILAETEGYSAQDGRHRIGRMLIGGMEYAF